MGVEKAELKRAVLHGLGADTEDMLEEAGRRRSENTGARQALLLAAKHVQAIAEVVDKELESGKLEELCEGEPLKIAKYAKRQIARCVDSLDLAAQAARNREIQGHGEVEALKGVVALLEKRHAMEDAAIQAFRAREAELAAAVAVADQVAEDIGVGRPTGTRPPQSEAAQRKAAEAAEAQAPAEAPSKGNGKAKAKRKAPSKAKPRKRAAAKRKAAKSKGANGANA